MVYEFENEKAGLVDMINDLRGQNRDYKKENLRLGKLEKNTIETKDIGIQLKLEDLSDFSENDDIRNYHENLNAFIIEGKKQDSEWATLIITDILSSKLIADYKDYKNR